MPTTIRLAISMLFVTSCSSPSGDAAPVRPASTEAPSALPAPPSAAPVVTAKPLDCAALAEHWRSVWTTEARAGLERRGKRAAEHAVARWGVICTKADPSPEVLSDLKAAQTFTALDDLSGRERGDKVRRLLALQMHLLAMRTRLAYAVAETGEDVCEDAMADAAFCGEKSANRVDEAKLIVEKNDAAACGELREKLRACD